MEYADPTKLRAYFFGNMYLSSIQHGIQAAHVTTKLFAQNPTDKYGEEFYTLHAWANDGVTKILLNGGYQSNLADIHSIFEFIAPKLGLPFAKFHEEEAALNGALTSVGIVVPEEVYARSEEGIFDWIQPAREGYDLGYLRNCMTPADFRAKLLEFDGKIRDRELYLDFLQTVLHLTLKTGRLAA